MLSLNQISQAYPPSLQAFKRNMLREYLQYKILEILFDSKYATKLSFLGGTALRIVYQTQRFSEDLDFDNFDLTVDDFYQISQIIEKGLLKEGLETETRNVTKKAFRCYVKIPKLLKDEDLSGYEDEKILIQLDTYPHHFDYSPDQKLLNKFDVFTQINVTPIDIILSQKIYAAFNRKRAKGRDFFDLTFLFGQTQPNYNYLEQKIGVNNKKDLLGFMNQESKELDFNQLAKDVNPFLFKSSDAKRVKLFPEYIQSL